VKNYSITINSLMLEITRRCNMSCEHCMRGEAQNLDMDFSVIDKLFESGVDFRDVTFTGGDPSLYPEAIRYFVDALKFRGMDFSHFYVKTNGKQVSLDMVTALLELYAVCDDKDYCVLAVSRDQFHEEGNGDPALYQGLRFYHRAEEEGVMERQMREGQIINEGNAEETGWGSISQKPSELTFDDGWDDEEFSVEQVQIAANGNVCGQCDISFEREDEETAGNILKDSLHNILARAYEQQLES